MALLFEVEGKPYTPAYGGNRDKPEGERIVLWYRPFSVQQIRDISPKLSRVASSNELDDDSVDFLREVIGRVSHLAKGTPSVGVCSSDPETIESTIFQDIALATDVVMAITSGEVSEADEVFFGWLSTGDGEG